MVKIANIVNIYYISAKSNIGSRVNKVKIVNKVTKVNRVIMFNIVDIATW